MEEKTENRLAAHLIQVAALLEIKPMDVKKEVESAIKLLAGKINTDVKPDDAMKFAQAALNLAHVFATVENTKR